jgi:hypothetical protein
MKRNEIIKLWCECFTARTKKQDGVIVIETLDDGQYMNLAKEEFNDEKEIALELVLKATSKYYPNSVLYFRNWLRLKKLKMLEEAL